MLKTRVITAVVLLVLLLALLASNSYIAVVIACAVFFAAAAWEALRLFGNQRAAFGAAVWTGVFLYIALGQKPLNTTVLFGFCSLIWLVRLGPSLALGLPAPGTIGIKLLTGIYGITILGCFFAILALFRDSPLYLFSVMALVWIADIGAYFAGKAFGKRKLAPSISPGKSWEGVVGGALAVLLLAGATIFVPALSDTFAVRLHGRFGWGGFIGILLLIVMLSVIGDLFESLLKRRAEVKDSSHLLPGHGGVLDRIDALIPTLPFAVLVGSLF